MSRARKLGEDIATLHTFGFDRHVDAKACVTELDWPESGVACVALKNFEVESCPGEKTDRCFARHPCLQKHGLHLVSRPDDVVGTADRVGGDVPSIARSRGFVHHDCSNCAAP